MFYNANNQNPVETLFKDMIQIFTTKKCRPAPLGSYRANVQNLARTLFIYMIEIFIMEKYRPTPPGSYKANTQNPSSEPSSEI